jgi:hypothetical protein
VIRQRQRKLFLQCGAFSASTRSGQIRKITFQVSWIEHTSIEKAIAFERHRPLLRADHGRSGKAAFHL